MRTHTIMAGMNNLLDRPAIWVDKETTFAQTLRSLKQVKQIAVDTESNSLYAYQEQVCLIQISTEKNDFILDGLAEMNLKALESIFADDSIEKIFHAAEYDIVCLKRDFGTSFNHLFDTMQAARILGFEKLGLSNLLEELFEIDQGKSYQKANWGKRPLTADMLHYARMDTHYLAKLRNYLNQKLIEKDLQDLAAEDFQRLCQIKSNHKECPLYAQVNGYQRLDEQQLRVLDELCQYRDKLAQKLNRPLFKVIGNAVLLAIAQACPNSYLELKEIQEVSPKLLERYADGLLAAVKKGLNLPPIHLKTHKRPSQAYINRLDALKEWRKKAAQGMGVQSDIVLPRDILEAVVGKNPANLDELHLEMEEIPWRFTHFGSDILKVIQQENNK
jgi:ribonuclease D